MRIRVTKHKREYFWERSRKLCPLPEPRPAGLPPALRSLKVKQPVPDPIPQKVEEIPAFPTITQNAPPPLTRTNSGNIYYYGH